MNKMPLTLMLFRNIRYMCYYDVINLTFYIVDIKTKDMTI